MLVVELPRNPQVFLPEEKRIGPAVERLARALADRVAGGFAGGIAWVTIFLWGGYLFGNVPIIKNNFGIVTIAIVAISVLPVIWGLLKPAPKTAS